MPCPKCGCKVTYPEDSIGAREKCANCNYSFYDFEDDGENIEEQEDAKDWITEMQNRFNKKP